MARSGFSLTASATASSPSRASAQTSKPGALEDLAQVEADDRLVLGDQDPQIGHLPAAAAPADTIGTHPRKAASHPRAPGR